MNKLTKFYGLICDYIKEENVLLDEPIRNHTYTKLGGKADIFVTPETIEELQAVLRHAQELEIPVTILGSGSNVIVKDGGIRGITVGMGKLTSITASGNVISAQSGARIIDVSRMALEHSLSGLEFACGIPGSVGGALYMNAGAYGGQISDVLVMATAIDKHGTVRFFEKEELALGYRKSMFQGSDYIIVEAEFRLEEGDPERIKAKMDELTEARESKQPLEYPSCGSVFKRPPGYFAGKLIQDSNLQGKRIGGAEVSKKHAGFIVNIDHATSSDYLKLIEVVRDTVKKKYDVELETEVIVLGED
ncbi:UDP-N-acetylenolpyruvoylglucosamine reductase [Bacillus sp. FJAT-27225]|uniref:UDP-N-acetylmuramate dehydrogenase n=1 Tax=Bacillus sp. FJAT-27225 TaxID=1743144 RepID=UPI00080C2203|nr:UDP-N-acetylmuramate dehydrogenase [Bacillus sp. FJAT-27225]OCA85729.1 UDP-N-acetylenolpyruvoylglucosamine reductase [Bacillus sp. FJAT-27225]